MYFFFLFLSQIPPFSTKHGSQHSKHCFLLFPVSVCFYLCFDMCFCFGFYFWLHPHPATGLLPYCVYLFCVQSLIKLPIIPCCFYFSLWSLANCFPALLSLISSSCFLRHVFYCFFFFILDPPSLMSPSCLLATSQTAHYWTKYCNLSVHHWCHYYLGIQLSVHYAILEQFPPWTWL